MINQKFEKKRAEVKFLLLDTEFNREVGDDMKYVHCKNIWFFLRFLRKNIERFSQGESCVLLNLVQKRCFAALTFFLCLHNQSSSIHFSLIY